MPTIQRDYLMEAEDRKVITDPDVQELVDATVPTDYLLSVKQVAAVLGNRSSEYVRQLVEAGELKKLGGKTAEKENYLIYRSSLIKYLERKTK